MDEDIGRAAVRTLCGPSGRSRTARTPTEYKQTTMEWMSDTITNRATPREQ